MRQQTEFLFRAAALILLWRGSWHLLDLYLFPNDPVLSNWSSLGLGVIALLFAEKVLAPRPKKVLDPKDCVDCAPQA